jgi:hypothetical protein
MSNQKSNTFINFVYLLLKSRKSIIFNFLIVVFLSYLVTLLLPKWYYSEAIVLPAGEGEEFGLSSILGLPRQLGFGGAGFMLNQMEAYNYLSILKSRRLQEDVIKSFNLISVYNVSDSSIIKTQKILASNIEFNYNEEGALVIGVYDQDPARAADMANFFVNRLNHYNIQFNIQDAKAERELLDERLEQNKSDLLRIENKIISMEEKFGSIIGPEQYGVQNNAIINLFANYVIKELQVEMYQKTLGENNPIYLNSLMELNILKERVKSIPEQTIESSRIFRDYLVQQKILELLTPMYEQAKLREMKEIPTVIILDYAVPAEKRSKPKRLFIALSVGIVAFIFSVIYLIYADYVMRLKVEDEESYDKIIDIKKMFVNTLKFRFK